MATVVKRGNSYKITVSKGYDLSGKQLREYMTWTPEREYTPKQLEKELKRQAVLFEERVLGKETRGGNLRLADFSRVYFEEWAPQNLKAKTAYCYAEKMGRVNQALGHIKLKDLSPRHISSFYKNLQEAGIRDHATASCKTDFSAWLRSRKLSAAAAAEACGVSVWVIKQIKAGQPVALRCAQAVAAAMGGALSDHFVVCRDDTPLKPGTIQTYHRTLSAVLSRAVRWGYIDTNPAARVDLPSVAGRQAAYLDEPDARRLLELLHDEPIKWRTLVTFDLLSGLRRGELAGLRWQDVDFDGQTITVSQTSNYVPGRGVYVDTPKTVTSSRPLRLTRSAFTLLLEYKSWQDTQRAALGDDWRDQDGRVFTTDDGAPIFPDSISQWFSKFVKRTGLPKVTVHSLRHTYASLMIADGTPLVVVAHQLGHAQPSTTANIYAHVIASAEAQAAKTLARFDHIIAPKADKKTAGE
jgi:integrase